MRYVFSADVHDIVHGCIQLAGVVNTYFYSLTIYWWFVHTVIIFWKVWFPTNARSFRVSGHFKYLHITLVLVTVLLALIPVAASLATGGYITSTDPSFSNFCHPRNLKAIFYTSIFQYSIFISLGVTFNLLTFWKLIRMNKFISKQVHAKNNYSKVYKHSQI